MATLTPVFNVQEQGAPGDICIDLYAAPVSAPSVGHSLTGDADDRNLNNWLPAGEQEILLAGRGLCSYKGSG